eukprot:scaffold1154_cov310-Pinguiococcus_pyrenoidosus.AAC.40
MWYAAAAVIRRIAAPISRFARVRPHGLSPTASAFSALLGIGLAEAPGALRAERSGRDNFSEAKLRLPVPLTGHSRGSQVQRCAPLSQRTSHRAPSLLVAALPGSAGQEGASKADQLIIAEVFADSRPCARDGDRQCVADDARGGAPRHGRDCQ